MSATVVYDNLDNANGEYHGTLLGGVKFYVHQRVPSREQLLERIKVNGGKIVKLEKLADVKLADHARKDVPPGFISWKYITDSVQRAELCNINDYKIGSIASRSVGGLQPAKGTKHPFTANEDERLVEHVLREIRHGGKAMGNKLFQDFAEKYPGTHTWQSFRDRWVKKLRLENRERMSAIEASPSPSPSPSPATPVQEPVRKELKSVVSPISDDSMQQAPRVAKARNRFTPEDDAILRKWVKEQTRHGEKINGNKIYQILTDKHPHHSWHSWRDRWVRHLSKTQETPEESDSGLHRSLQPVNRTSRPPKGDRNVRQSIQGSGASSSVSATPEAAPRIAASQITARTGVPGSEAHTSRLHENPTRTPVSSVPEHRGGFLGDSKLQARVLELEARRQRIQAARKIQRVWRSYSTRLLVHSCLEDITKLVPVAKGASLRMRIARRQLEGLRAEAQTESDEGEPEGPVQRSRHAPPAKVPTPKEQFYIYIQGFRELASIKPVPWVDVGRKSVELWDLWNAVTSQGENRDWEEIADLLRLDWMENPKVTGQLKAAFQKHLGEFEDLMQQFDDDEGDVATASEPGYPVSAQFASSPPVASLKRGYGDAMLSSSFGVSSPNKRRRFEPHEEIPYTPDKQLADRTSGLPDGPLSTPIGIRLKSLRSSPQQLPTTSRAAIEPETQDFQFGEADGEVWSSPSRQLRSGMEEAIARQEDFHSPPIEEIIRRKKDLPPVGVDSDTDEYFTPQQGTPSGNKAAVQHSVEKTVHQSLPRTQAAQSTSSAQLTARREFDSATVLAMKCQPASRMPPHGMLGRSQQRAPHPLKSGQALRGSFRSAPGRVSSLSRPASRQPTGPTSSAPLPPGLGRETSAVERFEALGYRRPIVEAALRATTNDIGLAGQLMERLRANPKDIPTDVGGVWTWVDDQNLRKVYEVDYGKEHSGTELERQKIRWAKGAKDRLVRKHGIERCEQRRVYLDDLENAEAAKRAKRKKLDWRAALQVSP